MAAPGEEKSSDFYAVLGLKKECTDLELRNAYKKLALRYHPDRCSASANSKFVEEAKKKFQAIQEAYAVLSDTNKRFLYDVGAYDSDDDENGMGDFLGDMAVMMNQAKSDEKKGEESFEDLQELFQEMFQRDMDAMGPSAQSSSSSSSTLFCSNNKRNAADMSSGKTKGLDDYSSFDSGIRSFCIGVEDREEVRQRGGERRAAKRRNGRKQKVSSGHDVSSRDYSSIST